MPRREENEMSENVSMMSMVEYIRSRGDIHALSVAISRRYRREPAVKAAWAALRSIQVEVMPNGEAHVVRAERSEQWAA
jgi:hypothetical protein